MLESLPVTCLRPLTVKNPRFRYHPSSDKFQEAVANHWNDYVENLYIEVPCGKCYLCRKKKANSWRVRLLEECKNTPRFRDSGIYKYRIIFVLFTFDNAHLPRPGTRHQFAELIRKWRDLWRKKFGCSPRYFATTDRGSQFGRLHLHLLIFDPYDKKNERRLSIEDLERYQFFWRNGMVRKPTWLESERGISYVTGYLTGSNLEKDATKHGKSICKESLEYIPFVFVSNGLGASFVAEPRLTIDPIKGTLLYDYNGYHYGIPSYWRYKLICEEDRWMSNLLHKKEKETYCDTYDTLIYSLSGQNYTIESLKVLYNSVYKKYDTDNNKYIKMLYAK